MRPLGTDGLFLAIWGDGPSSTEWLDDRLLNEVLDSLAKTLGAARDLRSSLDEAAAAQATLVSLTAAASRLSGLIDNLQSAILVEDENRRIALANQAFCDLFGVPVDPSLLQGADCEESLESASTLFENPRAFITRVDELLSRKELVVAEELTMTDGRTLERDYIPVFLDGDYRGHLWHYRDVSASRQAQKEIGDSAVRLYTVIETVGEGITLRDPDGRFEIYNSKMQELTGYSFSEACEDAFLERLYLNAAEAEAARERARTVLESGVEQRDVEVQIRTKDGEARIGLVSTSLLRYAGRDMLLSTFRDITEQKAAVQEVENLKNFYEQVLDAMPAQLAVFDPDLRYEYVSASAVSDPELRAWLVGRTDLEYCERQGLDTSVAQRRMTLLAEVAATKRITQFEEELVSGTGEVRHILRFVAPVLDRRGEVIRILGYGLDVTEQRLAEEARQESESRYEQLVEQAGDVIYRADLSGSFTYANRVAQELTGYSEAEIIGRWFAELVPEDWRPKLQEFYEEQIASGTENTYLEFPIVTRAGETLWLGQNVQLVYEDGECVGVQAVARDITARKSAMEALEESEARTRGVMESALDCLITIDESGNVIEFNPAAEETFGFRRAEVIGKPMAELIVPEKYRAAHLAGMERFRETGQGNVIGKRIEITAIRKDGTEFPVELAIKPIQLDAGQIFTAFLRDITDLKRTMTELEEARQIAIRSMKAREQFLANMSHEIRTPMNGILGMSHLLRGTNPTPKQASYLDAMTRSAENLLTLINDILDLAKIESGRIDFEHIPFDPREVVQHVVDMVQFAAEDKGLSLACNVSDDVAAHLRGDPIRLNQILLNLMSNAVKFTEVGGVTLSVQPVSRSGDGEVLAFDVTDTGIGIEAEHLGRIFDTFTQARSDTTRLYGGTGLGLSIVRELVERQGGSVSVDSVVGEGSTFRIEIPFTIHEQSVESLASAADAGRPFQGIRILVVEDNELNQLVTRSLLEEWGAEVVVAENGRVAVEAVKDGAYDLVLMDIQMPEMDGYQATREIRRVLEIPAERLPIVALTASTMVEHRQDIRSAGMNDFVLKPFAPAELRNCIVRHLGSRSVSIVSPSTDTPGIVNLDFLRRNAVGSESLIPRLIDMFIEKTPGMLKQMHEAQQSGTREEVGFVAHKLKSSVGMLGVEPLSEALVRVEAVARHREDGDLGVLVSEVLRLGEQAIVELRQERKSIIDTE